MKTQAEYQKEYRDRQREKMKELEAGPPIIDLDNPLPQENLTPLEYMLRVMNNPYVPNDRRDRMAIAAAPYVHGKVEVAAKTKKEEKQEAANEAGDGFYAPAMPPPPQPIRPELRAQH